MNKPPEDVAPRGQLPPQLQDLAESIDFEVRPAPGGRRTEVAARPRSAPSGVSAMHHMARTCFKNKEDGCVRAVFRPHG